MKFFALTLLLILAFQSTAFANNTIRVTIDGVPVVFQGQGPAIVNGRTLVPVRGVFEAIGFNVAWNDTTRTATLTNNEHVIIITIGSASFAINGTSRALDVPAQIVGGRTMLPIRAVLESVGFDLGWDEASRTVLVSSRLPNLVWSVEPTLVHESVRLCDCGDFVNSRLELIDPVTGLLLGELKQFHGSYGNEWVYDSARDFFGHRGYGGGYHNFIGMFPMSEFEARVRGLGYSHQNVYLTQTGGWLVVQDVDSSLRVAASGALAPDDWWSLTPEAFSGNFAVMYGREFVTGFIFDGGPTWRTSFRYDTIHVSRNGQWGMVDRNGNTVLPFMFENLVRIDENTAFARLGGRYGILDLRATVNIPQL